MEIRIGGIKIRMGFSFMAVTAVIFLIGNPDEAEVYFSVCLIHELIHGAVLCLCGEKLESIYLSGMGIKMFPKRRIFSTKKEIAVLASAPLGNIILGIFFRESFFGQINLMAGIFNLLPYSSLDGGSILERIIPEKIMLIHILRAFPLIISASLLIFSGIRLLPFLCVTALYFAADLDNSPLICYYREKRRNYRGKGT